MVRRFRIRNILSTCETFSSKNLTQVGRKRRPKKGDGEGQNIPSVRLISLLFGCSKIECVKKWEGNFENPSQGNPVEFFEKEWLELPSRGSSQRIIRAAMNDKAHL